MNRNRRMRPIRTRESIPEDAASLSMRVTATALSLVIALPYPSLAQQLPTGGAVAAGNVSIGTPQNGTLNINQSSNQAIINWNSFSVGTGGTVNFNQPGAWSATLNRVTGSTPSSIAGTINAPGTVVLVNPNGIAITKSGVINTGSFVASTLGITNEDFLAGKYHFQGNGASKAVTNAGRVNVSDGGFAAFLGGQVATRGVISARFGKVALGAGEVATLDLSGDGFISVAVPSNQLPNIVDGRGKSLVSNSGKINAPGGSVYLSAATASKVLQGAVNVPGTIRANSVGTRGGRIVLNGGDGGIVNVGGRLTASGGRGGDGGSIAIAGAKVSVSGTVAASGRNGGQIAVRSAGSLAVTGNVSARGHAGAGGRVDLAGRDIRLAGAKVDASGATRGGLVRIGGAFRGGVADPSDPLYQAYVGRWGALPPIAAASTVTADAATRINVSARKAGDGGTAVVWSNDKTTFAGTILGTGGAKSGAGGYAEVSGKSALDFSGRVNLKASLGPSGTLLLDPSNLTISTAATSNETSSGTDPVTFSPTNSAANSVLNTTDLQNALAGANVVATTNGTITVSNAVTWSNSNSLTLQTTTVTGNSANITINAAISASNGTLVLSSNGNTISQGASGSIAVANLSLLGTSTTTATLNNTGNQIGTVSANTGSVSLTNNAAAGLVLGTSSVTNNLTVVNTLGNLTQSGALTVGGTSSFTTSASNATIALTNAGNLLTGAASLNTSGASGNASLTNNQATALGTSNVGGDMTVTSAIGNLTQSGALTVAGASSFTTSASNATIALTNTGNLLTGAVSLNTSGANGNASLTNNKATVLAPSSVGGNLTVIDRVGNLTQSGALTVGGTSSFTTSTSNATITLTDTGNLFTGAVSVNTSGASGNASVTNNAAGLVLGASTVGGNLAAVSRLGNLTQTGVLTVTGTSSFTTSVSDASITLNSANALTGAASLNTSGTSGNATLTNNRATVLGASSVGGNLTVTASAGTSLTQTGALTVGGTSSFTTSTSNADITLTNAGNELTGAVSLSTTGSTGNASMTNNLAGGLVLGTSSIGGTLTVVSSLGDLTQSGALTVGSTSSFTTSAANATITLTNGGNLLTGAASLNTNGASGHASLTNNQATALGASTVGGNLTVTSAVGNLTQTGALTVAGTSSFTTSASNATITLTNTANLLTGAASLTTSGAERECQPDQQSRDGAGALERRRQPGGHRPCRQPDAERGADGRRDLVVCDLGVERHHHADRCRQPAHRRGLAHHQWGERQRQPDQQSGHGAGGLDHRRQSHGGQRSRQSDPDRGPDGDRHVVVHDLGDQRDDHADQHQQCADRSGCAEHHRGERGCQPDQ